MLELRVDAYKYVAVFRRHASERTEKIGIWFEILTGVTKLSVVVNVCILPYFCLIRNSKYRDNSSAVPWVWHYLLFIAWTTVKMTLNWS